MPDRVAAGLTWLSAQRAAHNSEAVTYILADGTEIALTATRGSSMLPVDTEFGALSYRAQDWMIATEDLVDGIGSLIVPAAEHKIRDGNGKVYQLAAPEGEDVWRWTDAYERTRRIHSKLISGEIQPGGSS